MIIEDEDLESISVGDASDYGYALIEIAQAGEEVIINKHQATQLIEVLTKWVNGEEVE